MLTGEQQNKISQPVPILGMLQTSKTLIHAVNMKKLNDAKPIKVDNVPSDHDNDIDYDDDKKQKIVNDVESKLPDKNPIINKRILLANDTDMLANAIDDLDDTAKINNNDGQLNVKHIRSTDEFNNLLNQNNTDQIVVVQVPETILDKDNHIDKSRAIDINDIQSNNIVDHKQQQLEQQRQQLPHPGGGIAAANMPASAPLRPPNEGRIVVYGDSNCLDSTHLEKPCFWLLDALLEYTMTSHVSTVLKDLNRTSSQQFDDKVDLPQRLPNNNLHLYSKVLENVNTNSVNNNVGATIATVLTKRPLPQCALLRWETPVSLNVTAPSDLYHSNNRDNDNELDGNVGALRRRLESQKGEVRSV